MNFVLQRLHSDLSTVIILKHESVAKDGQSRNLSDSDSRLGKGFHFDGINKLSLSDDLWGCLVELGSFGVLQKGFVIL
jgi:hypothetical protein